MHQWPDGPQPSGWVIPQSLQNRHQPAGDSASLELPAYAQQLPTGSPAEYLTPGQPARTLPSQPYTSLASGSPGGIPPWMTVQPARPRRGRRIAAVLCGLLVIAGGLGYAAIHRAGPVAGSHTLRLPGTAGSYVRLTTGSASQLGKVMTAQLRAAQDSAIGKPVIGVYGSTAAGAPSMLFIGGDAHANPRLAATLKGPDRNQVVMDGFMNNARITNTTEFPPGPLGGALRCGSVSAQVRACLWVDRWTIGSLFLLQPGSLADAATVTKDFRQVAER